MSWALVAAAGATVVGGAISAKGSKDAAKAAGQGSQAAIDEQRRQFDTVLGLQMPAISTGNAARDRLASILGLTVQPTAAYNASNPLQGLKIAGVDTSKFQTKDLFSGTSGGMGALGGLGVPVSGDAIKGFALGGPIGGILGGAGAFDRVESKNRPIAESDLNRLLQAVRDNPTAYDEQSEVQALISKNRPGAQGQIANALLQNKLGYFADPKPVEQKPVDLNATLENYPGFKFAVDQAQRASVAQASATGSSPISGNVLTALQSDIAGRVAFPAFQDYTNRLASLAGAGQVATSGASNAAINTGGNVSSLLQNQGDSRASGIIGQTGAIAGGLGGLAQLFGYSRGNMGGGTNPIGGFDFNRTFPT